MFANLKRFWELTAKSDKLKYCAISIMMLISGCLEFISMGMIPIFVAGLIDSERLTSLPYVGPWILYFRLDDPGTMLFWGGSALISIFILRGVYQASFFYLKGKVIYGHVARFAHSLFRAYMHTAYSFHLSRNTATIVRNIQTEAQRLATQVLVPLVQLLFAAVTTVALSLLVLVTDPLLGACVVGFVSLVLVGYVRSIRSRVHKHGKAHSTTASETVRTVNESVNGFKEIRLRGREEYFVGRMGRVLMTRARAQLFQNFVNQSMKPLLETLAVVAMIGVAFAMVGRGTPIQDIIPTVVLLATVMARILPIISQIARHYLTMQGAEIALENLLRDRDELERLAAERVDRYRPSGLPISFSDAIRLEGVEFTYEGASRPAVNGMSLTIPKGSSVAFVGSTGAGKTTIVDLMLGLLEPDKGRITVDGHDIRDNLADWQRHIGYIPQSIALFDASIRRNVALGIRESEIDDVRIREALQTAQLSGFVDTLENGVETIIGERGVRLSGGQRQRIGIARALYHGPDVLVLDEATAAVDNVTEQRLMEALDAARRDRTFIMIAHRLSTVRNCDRIYLLKEGDIAMAGTYDELLAHSSEFRNMAGLSAVAE